MKILKILYDILIAVLTEFIKETLVLVFTNVTLIEYTRISEILFMVNLEGNLKSKSILGKKARIHYEDSFCPTGLWKYKGDYFYVRMEPDDEDKCVFYSLKGSITVGELIEVQDRIKKDIRQTNLDIFTFFFDSNDCLNTPQMEKDHIHIEENFSLTEYIKEQKKKKKVKIVLDEEKRNLIKHIRWVFFKQKVIPQTFNLLLSGPPGCGKTSLVKEIAEQIGIKKIGVINLGGLTSETFTRAMRHLRELATPTAPVIVLIEDLDRVYDKDQPINKNGIDFSSLLNELSGVGSNEGLLFCVTVNHPDRLDSALLGQSEEKETFQSGRRFNYHLQVGMPTQDELHQLALNLLGKDFPLFDQILEQGKNDSFKKFTDRCQWALGEHMLTEQMQTEE